LTGSLLNRRTTTAAAVAVAIVSLDVSVRAATVGNV
jgi:hypothetical protein